jgi:hypothetical protein
MQRGGLFRDAIHFPEDAASRKGHYFAHEPAIIWSGPRLGLWTTTLVATAAKESVRAA